ncbi:MAG: peptidylprolyl isomerase [Proteobacteria bacterium]|jgi:FKBP-type peptidyl-prolyl cis-trans isomerase SlyD|nr:peptidylprolyl isomerase [Pseudomonadota bacterium]
MTDSLQTNKVTQDTVPSVIFVLSNDAGEVLDLATREAPMRYLHGHGAILRGLEKALDGAEVGKQFHVDVPPEDGYGLRDGEPQAVPKSIFPEGTPFRVGAGMTAKSEDGKPFPLWIVSIDEENVYVDANHPLAGQTLHFDVEVIAVRFATEDELKDGRVHDGCDMCRS